MPVGLWGFFGGKPHVSGAGERRNGKAIAKRRSAAKRARKTRARNRS